MHGRSVQNLRQNQKQYKLNLRNVELKVKSIQAGCCLFDTFFGFSFSIFNEKIHGLFFLSKSLSQNEFTYVHNTELSNEINKYSDL